MYRTVGKVNDEIAIGGWLNTNMGLQDKISRTRFDIDRDKNVSVHTLKSTSLY